jgi:hypothetical protein
MKNHYVYTLAYPHGANHPKGTIFSVGKGHDDRIEAHEKEARTSHLCEKCRVIRSIWFAGRQVQREIVFETDTEGEAFVVERDWITKCRSPHLLNVAHSGGKEKHYTLLMADGSILNLDKEKRKRKQRWTDDRECLLRRKRMLYGI